MTETAAWSTAAIDGQRGTATEYTVWYCGLPVWTERTQSPPVDAVRRRHVYCISIGGGRVTIVPRMDHLPRRMYSLRAAYDGGVAANERFKNYSSIIRRSFINDGIHLVQVGAVHGWVQYRSRVSEFF